MGRVPFIVPPRNRNVAGDFHRPYETQKFFTFHHITDRPKNPPVSTRKRYRVGQGTHVWEPAQSVTEKRRE